jgi:alanine racemase
MPLRAIARVNLSAIERNAARLGAKLNGGAQLCAVVKADGYGHGAVQAGCAALAGGAGSLAVATADEAAELREGAVEAPVLVMGAVSSDELPVALAAGAQLVAWDQRFVDEVARAVGRDAPVGLHVKLDTGMGRLGTRDADAALAVAERIAEAGPALALVGAMTHFATADDDLEFMSKQLEAYGEFVVRLRARWPNLTVHAANSAATLRSDRTHFGMVRCGIAVYGCDPMHEDPASHQLEPALELNSYVAAVKRARPGDSAGYGRRFVADRETWIATVPIGYGDGVRRALSNNCEVLVGGRRYPLVGTVSMDNVTVDVGPEPRVAVGDEVTLIGRNGGERQTAEDLAARSGTINYEILTGISRRVPRIYHRDGRAA